VAKVWTKAEEVFRRSSYRLGLSASLYISKGLCLEGSNEYSERHKVFKRDHRGTQAEGKIIYPRTIYQMNLPQQLQRIERKARRLTQKSTWQIDRAMRDLRRERNIAIQNVAELSRRHYFLNRAAILEPSLKEECLLATVSIGRGNWWLGLASSVMELALSLPPGLGVCLKRNPLNSLLGVR
jgi:hypothetical protein